MKLEEIGFYTLCDDRAKNLSENSPMWRCEVILSDICNFNCVYCRGLRRDCSNYTMSLHKVKKVIDYWCEKTGLKNIRFSGGEPSLYKDLEECVFYAKNTGVERIAVSTNGSSSLEYYKTLINSGVNDFSISLDACCSSFGKKMCGGIEGAWENVVENIRELSKLTYVTLGMVFTEETLETAVDVVKFGSSLGVADIRIITSAQDNQLIKQLDKIPQQTLDKHPILKYRVNNFLNGRNVRGITESDCHKCSVVIDDSAVAKDWHFPCIIYLREQGEAIGKIGSNMRKERIEWSKKHDSFDDPICRKNCLDVCIDYNNKRDYFEKQNQKTNE